MVERDEFWKQQCVRERNGFLVRSREEVCALPGGSRSETWKLHPQQLYGDAAGTELSTRFNAQRSFTELGGNLHNPHRWKKHPDFPMPLPTPPGELAELFATFRPQTTPARSRSQGSCPEMLTSSRSNGSNTGRSNGSNTGRRSASTGALHPPQRQANPVFSEAIRHTRLTQPDTRGLDVVRHTGSASQTLLHDARPDSAPGQRDRTESAGASSSDLRGAFPMRHAGAARQTLPHDKRPDSAPASVSRSVRWTFSAGHRPW